MTDEIDEPLHLKFRPTTLDAVYGQDAAVAALKAQFKTAVPHSYLFSGPSGTGKTTIARIIATDLGVDPRNVLEIDGATYRGINEMRQVAANVKYQAFGDNPKRFVVVDEAHALTKETWQSLLKITEEPPPHLYWAFCTTDLSRVPTAVQTRCAKFALKRVMPDILHDLLDDIVEMEQWDVPADVLHVCAERADGSPREALQNLSKARDCTTREQAVDLISRRFEDVDSLQLARLLCNPRTCGDWKQVITLLKKVAESERQEPPESIRLNIVNYAARVLLGQAGDKPLTDVKRAAHLLFVLDQFHNFFPEAEKFGPLLTACGRVVLGHAREQE